MGKVIQSIEKQQQKKNITKNTWLILIHANITSVLDTFLKCWMLKCLRVGHWWCLQFSFVATCGRKNNFQIPDLMDATFYKFLNGLISLKKGSYRWTLKWLVSIIKSLLALEDRIYLYIFLKQNDEHFTIPDHLLTLSVISRNLRTALGQGSVITQTIRWVVASKGCYEGL